MTNTKKIVDLSNYHIFWMEDKTYLKQKEIYVFGKRNELETDCVGLFLSLEEAQLFMDSIYEKLVEDETKPS